MSPTLYVALDTPSLGAARSLADAVKASADGFKIGLELFVAEGPTSVREIAGVGKPIFLDLKLHDIPETVERAVARVCALGCSLLTVHAGGGPTMLERAVARASKEATGLTIVAVTVLTSLDETDLEAVGISRPLDAHAVALATMAQRAGVSAFVCSPREVHALRIGLGPSALLITPGVRSRARGLSAETTTDDQKRTDTPEGAIAAGANAIVVGRPIRDAADPAAAAARIAGAIKAPIT